MRPPVILYISPKHACLRRKEMESADPVGMKSVTCHPSHWQTRSALLHAGDAELKPCQLGCVDEHVVMLAGVKKDKNVEIDVGITCWTTAIGM